MGKAGTDDDVNPMPKMLRDMILLSHASPLSWTSIMFTMLILVLHYIMDEDASHKGNTLMDTRYILEPKLQPIGKHRKWSQIIPGAREQFEI